MKRTMTFFTASFAAGVAAISGQAAFSADPHTLKYHDNDWISITGDVKAVHEESFTLDFGEGLITVEMDDWDWYDEADAMKKGEKATVYGSIDNGLYEAKTIEADTVFAHRRQTYFYANDVDEEGDFRSHVYYTQATPVVIPAGTWVSVTGTVKEIDEEEFILNTGNYQIEVDTEDMAYNPLDDQGYQQIDVGDRLYVTGEVEHDFFEEREIDASTITSITKDKTKKMNNAS